MAARTFEDSGGSTWEVFEVHRASDKPGAVSAGLEQGWLAFVKAGEKRRLAPFPADWLNVGDSELERLCAEARVAVVRVVDRPSRPRIQPSAPDRATDDRAGQSPASPATLTSDGVQGPAAPETLPDLAEVDAVVRAFAHEARTLGMPAVEAMVRMKAMLLLRFPGVAHIARDSRLVRRSFVDAYYFERDA